MKVMVVGASGVVGTAAVSAFSAAGAEVIAVSRRAPETEVPVTFEHHVVDLLDPSSGATLVEQVHGVTHLVYAAVHELPGLVRGWSSPEQMATNLAMLRHVLDPIVAAGQLQHVTLLQGTKAYGVHQHPIRIPSRESEPRDPHDNFYWWQEDHVRTLAVTAGFSWTILRPPLIVGPNTGVAMNLPPVLAAYAAIRQAEGLPFSYPGGPSYVAEAVDARIVADACVWAASSPAARNQHFNVTNGDVYEWRDLWPSLAEALGVETGPDERFRISAYLRERADLWTAIVDRHRLRPSTLDQLLGRSDQYADFQLVHGLDDPPPPALMSTVKIRQAGFTPVMDTADTFRHALALMQLRGVIPAP